MSAGVDAPTVPQRITADDARLEDLVEVLEEQTRLADYPHASMVRGQVLVYDASTVLECDDTVTLETEIARALRTGPGIVAFAGAFEAGVVDRATSAFESMIAAQRESGAAGGEHFAKPGANDRVWNVLEKLAVRAPDVFVDYYANDIVAFAARSWLGPAYQVTSQVVNPGGAAQTVHRDYHLGFQSDERCGQFPPHVHELSQVLTLQGAVAHGNMPLVSGPTLYLPQSQKYSHGYVAYRRPDFQEYFGSHYVQLPLAKGDAVFFNPALLHAAGSNQSIGIRRMANLLQISSAFGRAMETIDRARVAMAIYPALLAAADSAMSEAGVANVVAASAGVPVPDQPRPRPAGRRHGSAEPGRAPRPRGGQPVER